MAARIDPPWESQTRRERWAHCEPTPNGKTFLLSITDEHDMTKVTAEITLSEAMALRAYIGNVARQFTSQARFHSGA